MELSDRIDSEIFKALDALPIESLKFIIDWQAYWKTSSVLRKMLNANEIKQCNYLVKVGLMYKGHSDESSWSYSSVCYSIDSAVGARIETYIKKDL